MKTLIPLLLLTACGEIPPLEGRISPDIPDKCIEAIHTANEWWGTVTSNPPPLRLAIGALDDSPGYREVYFRAYAPDSKAIGHTDLTYTVGGETTDATIFLRGQCTWFTVVHELGHAFQLDHVEIPGNVMHPDEGENLDLTKKQVARAKRAIAY